MSTDRELLELAAKAAGLVGAAYEYHSGYVEFHLYEFSQPDGGNIWNPLLSDGDALRLAVKLLLRVDVDRSACVVMHSWKELAREPVEGDPYSATRRAIVRAAAEIGRQKP